MCESNMPDVYMGLELRQIWGLTLRIPCKGAAQLRVGLKVRVRREFERIRSGDRTRVDSGVTSRRYRQTIRIMVMVKLIIRVKIKAMAVRIGSHALRAACHLRSHCVQGRCRQCAGSGSA